MMDVTDSVVTIDAIGCQTEIAEKIKSKNADYCLALKGNQTSLHEDVVLYFESETAESKWQMTEKGHGQVESREYLLGADIEWLSQKGSWAGLSAIGAVKSRVIAKDAVREESRYFLTSLTNAAQFAASVRNHWSSENQLHGQIGVTFDEDGARMRKDDSPLNRNVLRKTTLPLIRNADVGKKMSVKRKLFFAALDVTVLEKVLLGGEDVLLPWAC